MSATQRLLGPAAVKSRSTRSGAGRAVVRRMVVHSPAQSRADCIAIKGLHWVGTLTTTYALQARTVHQASHALSSHLDAFVTQLGMNTRRTIRAPRTRVYGPDALGQPCILARPLRRTTFQPRVEAAGGDPQQATGRGDGIACLVRLHPVMNALGHEVECALHSVTNSKTRMGSSRSPVRTRPLLLPRSPAQDEAVCSRAAGAPVLAAQRL